MDIRFLLSLILVFAVIQSADAAEKKKIHDQETTYVQATPLKYSGQGGPGGDGGNELISEFNNASQGSAPGNPSVGQPRQNSGQRPAVINRAPRVSQEVAQAPSLKEEDSFDYFLSIGGGIVDHLTTGNITGQGAVGASVGALIRKQYALEVNFLYSNLESDHGYCLASNENCRAGTQVDLVRTNSVDQYSLGAAAKYYLDFGSFFVPAVGVVGTYTYREHYPNDSNLVRKSQAFDAGPTLGADFILSDVIRLAVDWRYMLNVTYEGEGTADSSPGLVEVPSNPDAEVVNFETSEYQVWMASLKFVF